MEKSTKIGIFIAIVIVAVVCSLAAYSFGNNSGSSSGKLEGYISGYRDCSEGKKPRVYWDEEAERNYFYTEEMYGDGYDDEYKPNAKDYDAGYDNALTDEEVMVDNLIDAGYTIYNEDGEKM